MRFPLPFLPMRRSETTREAYMRRIGIAPLPTRRQAVKAAQRIVRDAAR